MFFVQTGEVLVRYGKDEARNDVVKLMEGSWFWEECLFLNKQTSYSVTVSSEYAEIYKLDKWDAYNTIPNNVISEFKQNYRLKKSCRK